MAAGDRPLVVRAPGPERRPRAQMAAYAAAGSLAVILIAAGWLARRSLDRRRLAAWDSDWLANGPRWSQRR